MAERPTLGEWCNLTATVTKTKHDRRTYWYRHEERKDAMYIGRRTAVTGRTVFDGDPYIDGAYVFRPEKYDEVWLFVTSERNKVIYAYPSDVVRGVRF